jgi:hypothetical protein
MAQAPQLADRRAELVAGPGRRIIPQGTKEAQLLERAGHGLKGMRQPANHLPRPYGLAQDTGGEGPQGGQSTLGHDVPDAGREDDVFLVPTPKGELGQTREAGAGGGEGAGDGPVAV